MDEVYKVVLPSFLASGGDGYQMIKDEVLQHDSGKHSVSSSPYPKDTQEQQNWSEEGSQVTHDARRAKPKPEPGPMGPTLSLLENSSLVLGEYVPCLSAAHVPIYPSPGKNIFKSKMF